jgi:hypothetical protein
MPGGTEGTPVTEHFVGRTLNFFLREGPWSTGEMIFPANWNRKDIGKEIQARKDRVLPELKHCTTTRGTKDIKVSL